MAISKEEAVKTIVGVAKGMGITSPAQIAYILATAEHESMFNPSVTEIGCASQAAKHGYRGGAKYCGRGYTQITHIDNYEKMGKLIGVDLKGNPELALDPKTSTTIIVYGMKNGTFTNRKLDDYINGSKTDFIGARKIINGTDQAPKIAALAEKWLKQAKALLEGATPIFTSVGQAATALGLPGDYSPGGTGVQGVATGLISAVFSKICTEQFPINFTLREAISYTGCKTKLASAQMGGAGLGYPPQAMQVSAASATGLGTTVPGTPVCAGCFIWPVDKKFPTTSARTQSRNGRPHNGTDIGCPSNTPIWAAGDGKIIANTFDGGGYGNYITIQHPNGLFTRYAHMVAPGLATGTEVKQGQVIGKSGNTGVGSGPHLHFEVLRANTFGRSGYKDTLEPSQYCKKP